MWLEGRKLDGLERSTTRQYEQHLRLHINPIVGDLKLSRLTTPRMQQVRDQLLRTKSRAMARTVLQSIRMLLTDAQRRGLVVQNVATPVTIRRNDRDQEPVTIPSKDEIRILLNAVQGRLRPFLVTAIFTGMRASELRGLTWDNVDFEAWAIRVTQRADRWNEMGPPKSKAGRREIPMTPMLENTLREWQPRCPDSDLRLVFPTRNGKIQRHTNIVLGGVHPLQIKCGLVNEHGRPKYGLHDLRHFFASWLIDQEFPPKRVQTILGHSSIQVTFDVYGHLFPSPDDHEKLAAAELALVGPVPNKPTLVVVV